MVLKNLRFLLIILSYLTFGCLQRSDQEKDEVRRTKTDRPTQTPDGNKGPNVVVSVQSNVKRKIVENDVKELIGDFIPKGWKVIAHAEGDLNRDGISDAAIVIENTDPDNFRYHNGLGADTLNLNPRTLMVFFKERSGYRLVSQNNKGFVPTANDAKSPCLADPLLQDGDIGIKNGLLGIYFQYWLSCGSWLVNNATYKFRYQHRAMELIGFEHTEYHRASGEVQNTSINYSTKKKSITTGDNMFDDKKGRPKTTWSSVDIKRLYRLEDCNNNTYFDILGI